MDNRVREFAARAHAGQLYNGSPYTVHLDEVVELVATETDKRVAVEAAYLHDVLEDTNVTYVELAKEFGHHVANIVKLLSDPDGKNRRERKLKLHMRLVSLNAKDPVNRAALLVKAADRLANVRACVISDNKGLLKMYRREHKAFRTATRREGLADRLWNELDDLLS